VEAKLGEGAMGWVFEARGPRDDRVALKVAKPEAAEDPRLLKRLEQEVSSPARVSNRHVVKVLDAGKHERLVWLTQRLIPGGTLSDEIARQGRLQLASAVRICLHVASGLDALHEAGLVHRDLKPANILLDEDSAAYITDFGLVMDLKASVITQLGMQPGTVNYMAPEQIKGDRDSVTARTDVYALGCVMCACLCGTPPFADRGSWMRIGWAHLQDEPPDPCAGREDLPAGLGWAVTRALMKDPSERPPTAIAYARLIQVGAGLTSLGVPER